MYATGAMESCQLNAARIVVRRLNVVVRSHISRPTIYSESETMGYKPNDGIMSVYGRGENNLSPAYFSISCIWRGREEEEEEEEARQES